MDDDLTPTSVYRYYDEHRRLLYVGVTARGIKRGHEHSLTKEWWPLAVRSTVEHFRTRGAALAHECYLIKKHQPPYNVVHNPDQKSALDTYNALRLRAVDGSSETEHHADQPPSAMKQARQAWYALSKAEKPISPCITCGEVPTPPRRGPQCTRCHQAKIAMPT
jgi:hypothetical protein